jgi:hypothetical protein
MSKLLAVRYDADHKGAWDDFVTRSRNGVFLFYRDYMDYHADRFPDHSLMFYDERERLIAVLPATVRDGIFSSHIGLTFGGMISDATMKVDLMLNIFDVMIETLRAQGFRQMVYKAIPHIYHRIPAEEDLYALFRRGGRVYRRDVTVTIDLGARLPFSHGRRWALKQAERANLSVARSFDFSSFMAITDQLLITKYQAHPVHTETEIKLLADRFPDNIKLFASYRESVMMAGVIIYESERVAHAQYIGAVEEGYKQGAVDCIINYLISDYYNQKRFFDFGVSTEPGGTSLNAELIQNKQSYGARAIAHDFYELDLYADDPK